MDIVSLVIGLASGALGGNVAGGIMKSPMGTTGRSVTGIVGGAILSFVAQQMGIGGLGDPTAGAMSVPAIVSSVLSGGVGGGVLTAILGMLKK